MSNTQLNNIERSLGRLEGKVDGINKRLDKANGSIANHDKRINDVEDKISFVQGRAATLGALAGFIVSIVGIIIVFLKR